MIWVRKGFVHLLSLVLFFALVGGVLAGSISLTFGHPAKMESWLDQSGLYKSFTATAIKQADDLTNSSANNQANSAGVSLNDAAVQQAAESAFPASLLQQDVTTVLNSNYAWLEGKTSTPAFSIDLMTAKQSFARQVGQNVQMHLSSLPVCTTAQLAAEEQASTNDPLSLTCRPANLDPLTEGTSVTQQLANNTNFLNKPIITANSISPNTNQSKPYYQRLSFAPKVYRLATKLPWVLGAVAVLCAVGIIFVAPRKRKGLRRVGIVLMEAGIILVAIKFIADTLVKKLETKIFNQASIGQLQQSLTNFVQHAESQLVKLPFYGGIVFVILAIIIFVVLLSTRHRSTKLQQTAATIIPKTTAQPDQPQPAAPPSTGGNDKPRPKRPRLIQ